MTTTASDGALARAIQAGASDEARAAEAELCRRFAPRIRLFGVRHLRDETAAADLTQRVLELTLTKLRSGDVREPDRIVSFVLGAARMTAHDMRRRRAREVLAGPEVTDNLPAPEGDGLRPLASQRLAECLEALGGRERSVVLLSFYGEESAADIAAALALSAGNVRVIRHRAVERLRQCMGLGEEAA